jgi:hypothetical protein
LHGAVAVEDIHVVGKRRVGILDKPHPHNAVRKAASTRQTAEKLGPTLMSKG